MAAAAAVAAELNEKAAARDALNAKAKKAAPPPPPLPPGVKLPPGFARAVNPENGTAYFTKNMDDPNIVGEDEAPLPALKPLPLGAGGASVGLNAGGTFGKSGAESGLHGKANIEVTGEAEADKAEKQLGELKMVMDETTGQEKIALKLT